MRRTGFCGQEVRLFQLFAGEGLSTVVIDILEDEMTSEDVARLGRNGGILRRLAQYTAEAEEYFFVTVRKGSNVTSGRDLLSRSTMFSNRRAISLLVAS